MVYLSKSFYKLGVKPLSLQGSGSFRVSDSFKRLADNRKIQAATPVLSALILKKTDSAEFLSNSIKSVTIIS